MQILVVDDHQILCVALCEHLERNTSQTLGAITASPVFGFDDAVSRVQSSDDINLVLLDLDLDKTNNGISTLQRFQEYNTRRVPVAVFTGKMPDDGQTIEMLRECISKYDAIGILLKKTDINRIFVGLKRILEGELWVPQEILMALASNAPKGKASEAQTFNLTPKEWEIARCLTLGLPDKAIANQLGNTAGTIRQMMHTIYGKLGVQGRTQAALLMKKMLDDGVSS
jgi:two-component system nitrate/nitrite response regulator NarL